MSDSLRPLSFEKLMGLLIEEHNAFGSIFGVKDFYKAGRARLPPTDILKTKPSGTPSSKAVLMSFIAYHAFTYSPKASATESSEGCSEEKVLSPMEAEGFSDFSLSGKTVLSSKNLAPERYAAMIPCAVWVMGPAAGPTGFSILIPKIGSLALPAL